MTAGFETSAAREAADQDRDNVQPGALAHGPGPLRQAARLAAAPLRIAIFAQTAGAPAELDFLNDTLAKGLSATGDHVVVTNEGYVDCDVAVIMWSPRRGPERRMEAARRVRHLHARNVLIVENAIVRDLPEFYYRIGFDHVTRRGRFVPPAPATSGRAAKLGVTLKPWRRDGDVIVVAGQVPEDYSLEGQDCTEWVRHVATSLRSLTQKPVVVRPHPLDTGTDWETFGRDIGIEISRRPQHEDIERAARWISFTSGSSVDAVIAGVPSVTLSAGNFAWDVSGHSLASVETPVLAEREAWLENLLHAQWSTAEIARGEFWTGLRPLVLEGAFTTDTERALMVAEERARALARRVATLETQADVTAAEVLRLSRVADATRAELANERARLDGITQQMSMATRIREALHERAPKADALTRGGKPIAAQEHVAEPKFVFDAPRDLQFAQPPHAAFENVALLFNQHWVGIRAAASGFPGVKLAVSAHDEMSADEIKDIAGELRRRGVTKVVVHGFSGAMGRTLPALKAAVPELKLYGVWHGTLAAWALDHERVLVRRYLELADEAVFERVHFMRTGAHLVHAKAWPHLLPNVPPNVNVRRARMAFQKQPATAIFASWNNTWKNLYTNVYGALGSSAIGEVLSYAPVELDDARARRVVQVPYGSRSQHFETLAGVDLCLNATVVDCHPMAELEALAVDTPTLRSNLDLDFDAGQPYAELMTVRSCHDAAEIAATIDRVAGVAPEELQAMIASYRAHVTQTSFERYAHFLGS